MNKFKDIKPNIYTNPKLYLAQIEAYQAAFSHYTEFKGDFKKRETLIVMPTGSGKTGVMSLLPFNISNGRVLIITPGHVVNESVFKQMDSINNPQDTFWYKRNIIKLRKQMPVTYLYSYFDKDNEESKRNTLSRLNRADIVITNIHRIDNSSEDSRLTNLVDPDFFDMIIIDEAHHVAADMWSRALDYFTATKVIKLTATPFRGDKKAIIANDYDLIYEYTLGEAIRDGLVKNIVKHVDLPGEMKFINKVTNETYSLHEAKQKMGNDWVNKSIALSEECSKAVIKETKKKLMKKRRNYPNHQVLAVTCNDEHAQQICEWFEEYDLKATYVSTRSLNRAEINRRLADFASGKFDVMVGIQLLSEGYDNPNISLISLFRPFKTLTPYSQAIGRGLRKIYAEDLLDLDNYCDVIHHKELGLEELWSYYTNQRDYAEILQDQLKYITEQMSFSFDELGFVEKKPSTKFTSKDVIEDSGDVITKSHTGQVSGYTSLGIGQNAAYLDGDIDKYLLALKEADIKAAKELAVEENRYRELVKTGILNENEAAELIEKKHIDYQNKLNKRIEDNYEIYYADSLKADFKKWLNTRTEDFFSTSVLNKKGFDIYTDNPDLINSDKIDNIGYIIRNIRQSLFKSLKHSSSNYDSVDFAKAKEITIGIFKFWLDQYGEKE